MIIELVPSFSFGIVALFDKRVIVTRLCSSSMNYNTLQLEFVVVTRML